MEEEFLNDSYSFFGPLGMAFSEDNVLDERREVKIFFSILLGLTMMLSLVGNICTCAVITRDRTMRTPTNCYLFNLAITDLLMALFVPIEIYIIWIPDMYPLGEEGCRIHFILWDSLSNCSALTISAFSIERYLVISKPFLRQKLSLKSRLYIIITLIWFVSFAFCIPDIFYIDLLHSKKYIFCYYSIPDQLRILVAVELVVFFIIPMTLIFVVYILIAIKLRSAISKSRNSPVNGNQNRDRAVKMLAAVAASFFFCWSPYNVMRFMVIHPTLKNEDSYNIWHKLNYLCYNVYVSTVINPILYSLMSQKFRQAFKDFFKGRHARNRTGIPSIMWTSSSVK